jgi:outer membrane murein-binding lipoprotein Lpp
MKPTSGDGLAPMCRVPSRVEGSMTDRVNELARHVEDALLSVDELQNDPGELEAKDIENAKEAIEKAQDAVDEMEDSDE